MTLLSNGISTPKEKFQGTVKIISIQSYHSPFVSGWKIEAIPTEKTIFYRPKLQWIVNDFQKIPKKELLSISAIIKKEHCHTKMVKLTSSTPIGQKESTAYKRLIWKQKITQSLAKQMDPTSLSYLLSASIISAESQSRYLNFTLGQAGLQHMLAISGYHVNLIASLALFWILACSRSIIIGRWLLLPLLGGYLLFTGISIPILRAIMAIVLKIIGDFLGRKSHPGNLLGAAICFELLIDPYAIYKVSFQLSYIATFAMIYGFPFIDSQLKQWIYPQRDLLKFSLMSAFLHLGAIGIRKIFSLNIAIHLLTLPLILYHFHAISLASFIYNLYLPPLIGLSIIGIAMALSVEFLLGNLFPFLWEIVFYFSESYLWLIEYCPKYFSRICFQLDSLHGAFCVIIILPLALFLLTRSPLLCSNRCN